MNVNVNELPEYESKVIPQCIFAMASSRDYTFEQAITVYTLACDRCKQVLLQKYLKGRLFADCKACPHPSAGP